MEYRTLPKKGEKTSIMQRPITRRGFLGMSVAAVSALALSGCSWTPRSEASRQSSQNPVETQATTEAANIDDKLVLIDGGTLLMGSPETEAWRNDDEVQHEVEVSSFYMAPYETTASEYSEVMGTPASSNPLYPVTGVTWLEAVAFCNALSEREGLDPAYAVSDGQVTWDRAANGYRLPTEAEWEYACRAGTTTPFNTETSIDPDAEANYYGHYPYEIEDNYFDQGSLSTKPGTYRQHPVDVGSFAPNKWGLYDMHGNAAEWVWDAYGSYAVAAEVDPTGADPGMLRVNRGGGWNDFAKNLRSAYRAALSADSSSPSVGFRVARNADDAPTGMLSAFASGSDKASGNGLIAFYSWGGNTRKIAKEIAAQTGYDIVELELEDPYSSDYNTVLDEAQRDQNVQARPALTTDIGNMEEYSTVLVGYPNWWASIPMPIATFLESYDFAGKTIVPFCSNGGGGLGQSVSAISKLAPNSIMGKGLSVYYSGGSDMPGQVTSWLEENGLS